MDIQRSVLLKKFTTFRIGGTADFFVHVHSINELKEALLFANKKKLNIFILGGGSNVVFSDDGFRGLVIKIEIKVISYRNAKEGKVILEVGGGEVWDEFVSFCVSHGFYGIENLSAIPGTVGAAPVQNIGAYGVEIKDFIKWVEAIDIKTGEVKRFTKKECAFKYRDSFFKTLSGRKYVITRVSLILKKDGIPNLSYIDLSRHFNKNQLPSLIDVRDAIIHIRNKKFPDLNVVGTAGSFFKNPILTKGEYKELQNKFPTVPSYKSGSQHIKVPLGFILEEIGWKGRKYNQVSTYEKQALVVVNNNKATQKQLREFADMIEKDVKEKTGIVIEREIIFVA